MRGFLSNSVLLRNSRRYVSWLDEYCSSSAIGENKGLNSQVFKKVDPFLSFVPFAEEHGYIKGLGPEA